MCAATCSRANNAGFFGGTNRDYLDLMTARLRCHLNLMDDLTRAALDLMTTEKATARAMQLQKELAAMRIGVRRQARDILKTIQRGLARGAGSQSDLSLFRSETMTHDEG